MRVRVKDRKRWDRIYNKPEIDLRSNSEKKNKKI